MAQPTAQEQLMLELVNRARLNPAAEAFRQGLDLNSGIAAGSIDTTSKQPLAFNLSLIDSARGHSTDMDVNNFFTHSGSNGSTIQSRMEAAGYSFGGSAWGMGENQSFNMLPTNTPAGLTSAIIANHNQLFASIKGHREQIFNDKMREIGIGQTSGSINAGETGGSIVTQNFAFTGGRSSFLTGVVYDDKVDDNFYGVGEGRGGVSISIDGGPAGMDTWGSGGYSIANVSGLKSVTFSGGGLAHSVNVTVGMPGVSAAHPDGVNVKLDLVDGDTIQSSAYARLGTGAVNLVLLGTAISGTGNAVANIIVGDRVGNLLQGLAGNDTLKGGAGSDRMIGGSGHDTLLGGTGRDAFDFNFASHSAVGAANRDVILDFHKLEDVIDLQGIDANGLLAGDGIFTFVGTAGFSGDSQVHYFQQDFAGTVNDRTIIEGNLSGTAAPEFQIELRGLFDLAGMDFVL